jgi:hypothetical protein
MLVEPGIFVGKECHPFTILFVSHRILISAFGLVYNAKVDMVRNFTPTTTLLLTFHLMLRRMLSYSWRNKLEPLNMNKVAIRVLESHGRNRP